jgi:hypothetical protein
MLRKEPRDSSKIMITVTTGSIWGQFLAIETKFENSTNGREKN